jgi:hypothetical protein
MATKIDAWKATTDGSLHPSEKVATEHDLENFAAKVQGGSAVNNSLSTKLAEHADEGIRLLQAYVKCHPRAKAPEGGTHSSEAEGTHSSEREPIPELVYWDGENSNFYGVTSRRGQGQEFFDKWFPRRDEFPTTVHEDDRPVIATAKFRENQGLPTGEQ